MQAPLDLELIFPMKDAPSAAFMAIKAVCLHEAGIISKADKLWVDAKVQATLAASATACSNLRAVYGGFDGRDLRETKAC